MPRRRPTAGDQGSADARAEGFVQLTDGRRLAFLQLGAPDGPAVFYFHGLPGSRLEARFAATAAAEIGVRLLAVDRPGIGRSDPRPGRALLDGPDDVTVLADALGIGRFCVLGVSGGGPCASACAWKLGERVRAAAVVCGVGPLDRPRSFRGMSLAVRPFLALARHAPAVLPALGVPIGGICRGWPAGPLALMRAVSAPPDRAVLAASGAGPILAAGLAEAFRQGARGAIDDLRLLVRRWGFDPAEIRVPVRLWHGERDRTVPMSASHHLAAAIPGSRLHLLPDEGHYSLPIRHVGAILDDLLAAAGER